MDGSDGVDDRTFRLQFTGDGAAKLRERVTEKLKEFMGDYTDDTLVEYVIVLVKNGRRKEEAKNELNVFLGDDSDSFVSWLWDHLGSNIHLYAQPQVSHPDGAAKIKPVAGDQAKRNDSSLLDSESEKVTTINLSRARHNREWKSLARNADEPPPFQSSSVDHVHTDKRRHSKVVHVKRSPSPQHVGHNQKKRSWPDESVQTKRRVASPATIAAPRRLLQFAVRDAVATSRPSSSASEPALKRLRSVVSTSAVDSSVEGRQRRISSVARVPNAMVTAIKAVEEAAKDVMKSKTSRNVFDRLGRGMDVSQISDQEAEVEEAAVQDEGYGDFNQDLEHPRSTYLQRSDYTGEYAGNVTMLETDDRMSSDSASDNDGYDDVNVMGHRGMNMSQSGTFSGNQRADSVMLERSVAKSNDDVIRKWKDQDQPAPVTSTSHKIVNISVNVNTWKPPHYQGSAEISDLDIRKSVQESESGLGKSSTRLMKENNIPVTVGNLNANTAPDTQKVSQKAQLPVPGSYSAGLPTEDADSRTIFVNNVHFAATKDGLSRHFNKFGEVLKVIILTDAATGQPKGSAYVEFMRKESAENALSLDGTSFMSRILKVVRKGSAHQEVTPMMTWPRVVRGSPYAPSRFARVPFARGMKGAYRARPPIKPGARSLQWKRDAQTTLNETASSKTVPSPAVRSMTYIRTEAKTNGGSAAS
ncbi:hypothetical protein NMG60_11029427 [Bertholletia excelsa]